MKNAIIAFLCIIIFILCWQLNSCFQFGVGAAKLGINLIEGRKELYSSECSSEKKQMQAWKNIRSRGPGYWDSLDRVARLNVVDCRLPYEEEIEILKIAEQATLSADTSEVIQGANILKYFWYDDGFKALTRLGTKTSDFKKLATEMLTFNSAEIPYDRRHCGKYAKLKDFRTSGKTTSQEDVILDKALESWATTYCHRS